MRIDDLVGRTGGDEFGVFLPGVSRENAETVAERIRHTVAETLFETEGSNWPLSVSVGAVLFDSEIDFDTLFRAAGPQVQVAKGKGATASNISNFVMACLRRGRHSIE